MCVCAQTAVALSSLFFPLVPLLPLSAMACSFFGAEAHTQSQDWVTAIDSKLGCPTESLQETGNFGPWSAPAAKVSPTRPGFWPKDPATAGPHGPVGLKHQGKSIKTPEDTPKNVYGAALNFQRWTDIDGDSDPDEEPTLADFGLDEEGNAVENA